MDVNKAIVNAVMKWMEDKQEEMSGIKREPGVTALVLSAKHNMLCELLNVMLEEADKYKED